MGRVAPDTYVTPQHVYVLHALDLSSWDGLTRRMASKKLPHSCRVLGFWIHETCLHIVHMLVATRACEREGS